VILEVGTLDSPLYKKGSTSLLTSMAAAAAAAAAALQRSPE
jgi:hypothetical protein